MKKILIHLLASTLFLGSCSDDQDCCTLPDPVRNGNVNFSQLHVGQKTTYVRYSTTCQDVDGDFKYTGDELTLEVIETNGQMRLQESLSEDSPLYISGSFQDPVSYPVSQSGGTLTLPERWNSALFFFYDNDVITLSPTHDVVLSQDACKLTNRTDPFIGNDIGILPDFEIGPLKHEGKTAVSCEPFFNLDAYLIYDQNQLHMSHVITFAEVGGQQEEVVTGWVMLDE